MKVNLTVHDLYALVEVSWNRPTGSYQTIMDRLVDNWYELITDRDRALLLQWVRKWLELDKDPSSVCGKAQRIFLGRFDPEAQFVASNGQGSERCFKVGDRYYINSRVMIAQDPGITFTPFVPL